MPRMGLERAVRLEGLVVMKPSGVGGAAGRRVVLGQVVSEGPRTSSGSQLFRIVFEDGDEAHFTEAQVRRCLLRAHCGQAGSLPPEALPTTRPGESSQRLAPRASHASDSVTARGAAARHCLETTQQVPTPWQAAAWQAARSSAPRAPCSARSPRGCGRSGRSGALGSMAGRTGAPTAPTGARCDVGEGTMQFAAQPSPWHGPLLSDGPMRPPLTQAATTAPSQPSLATRASSGMLGALPPSPPRPHCWPHCVTCGLAQSRSASPGHRRPAGYLAAFAALLIVLGAAIADPGAVDDVLGDHAGLELGSVGLGART